MFRISSFEIEVGKEKEKEEKVASEVRLREEFRRG
jgi:hypothetical protein